MGTAAPSFLNPIAAQGEAAGARLSTEALARRAKQRRDIQGMIGLTQDDTVRTASITVTCATPGSGLFAVPGGSATDMLTVDARKVSVDHPAGRTTRTSSG